MTGLLCLVMFEILGSSPRSKDFRQNSKIKINFNSHDTRWLWTAKRESFHMLHMICIFLQFPQTFPRSGREC